MNTSRLRQIWTIIENTQADLLLNLDPIQLSQFLIQEIQESVPLNPEDDAFLNSYIQSRISLIRDLAQSRQSDLLIRQ
ncbi:MAG: hypothetical protein QNJ38_10700 [Prochloraceae cyanobacterium]|nr:hypothetical protein [Prochloraceae cyanobacterium]